MLDSILNSSKENFQTFSSTTTYPNYRANTGNNTREDTTTRLPTTTMANVYDDDGIFTRRGRNGEDAINELYIITPNGENVPDRLDNNKIIRFNYDNNATKYNGEVINNSEDTDMPNSAIYTFEFIEYISDKTNNISQVWLLEYENTSYRGLKQQLYWVREVGSPIGYWKYAEGENNYKHINSGKIANVNISRDNINNPIPPVQNSTAMNNPDIFYLQTARNIRGIDRLNGKQFEFVRDNNNGFQYIGEAINGTENPDISPRDVNYIYKLVDYVITNQQSNNQIYKLEYSHNSYQGLNQTIYYVRS